jgi:hypothetical protein
MDSDNSHQGTVQKVDDQTLTTYLQKYRKRFLIRLLALLPILQDKKTWREIIIAWYFTKEVKSGWIEEEDGNGCILSD